MRGVIGFGVWLVAACSGPHHGAPTPAHVAPRTAAARVAITFDDLGSTVESAEPALSGKILKALASAGAPVTVFANCQNLKRETLLLWQRAGATFGNHTATHLSLDVAGPDDTWWKDVASCDALLTSALGERVPFFRFPYLRYGRTPEFHARAAEKLASLGYSIGHVTAATSEWLLAGYYEAALKNPDDALVQELVAAYVQHMLDSLQAARELAIRKTGHDAAQITLVHVNQLAADHLSDVLRAMSSRGWQFVSLKEALADPVYALPDAYVGGCGCSWLARIEPALTRDDTYVFGDYEDQLRQRFERRSISAPSVAAAAATLRLTYLGTAGWAVTSGSQTLLLDPYFSRLDVADPTRPLLPDQAAISRYAPAHADYILVGHSHYDHLLDVPSIAERTQATVVGSASTLNVARAAGISEAHLRLAVPGQDLRLGDFSVRPLASLHSITGEKFGTIPAPVKLPLASKGYQEGSTLAYLVSVAGHSLLFLDSANFDAAALIGVHPDIAVLASALRDKVPQYTCRVLKALDQPAVVLPNHFDAHWRPFQARETRIEPEQRDDLAKFTAEVAACAPATQVIVPKSFEALTF